MIAPWKKSYDQPRQHIKKQKHYFTNKGTSNQGYGFSSSHVWMWELDYKESWVLKNWFFWTVMLEKTLETPLDCKEIQPIHLKGNQPWIFIGRTDAEAETPILWPPNAKSWPIGKDPDSGKEWRREEKGTTEDEMVGWHQRLNGHEFWAAPWVGDGQGSLDWVRHDWATEMNWTDCTLFIIYQFSSAQFSFSVVSDYVRHHESQHPSPPCSTPTPGVHSNSCPLSWWCHPTISSSVFPFSSCL